MRGIDKVINATATVFHRPVSYAQLYSLKKRGITAVHDEAGIPVYVVRDSLLVWGPRGGVEVRTFNAICLLIPQELVPSFSALLGGARVYAVQPATWTDFEGSMLEDLWDNIPWVISKLLAPNPARRVQLAASAASVRKISTHPLHFSVSLEMGIALAQVRAKNCSLAGCQPTEIAHEVSLYESQRAERTGFAVHPDDAVALAQAVIPGEFAKTLVVRSRGV